jgi:hypothetical protein
MTSPTLTFPNTFLDLILGVTVPAEAILVTATTMQYSVQTSKGRTIEALTASDHPLPAQLAQRQPTLVLSLKGSTTQGGIWTFSLGGVTPLGRMLKWKLRIMVCFSS